ncbi:hypothetical protein HMPREF1544_07012 [Mucor circinelloides 1006PhL]|uniref:Uncharacterized protein n=1 Tax=Mucor circinelloides f. circinelloides (strain 1006PhL) TaxID=1220926 RepID=S2K1Z2_MUCC1|nr:hypothetical protein HMPREF1544_07012 [Mucor circinelloides 1006PhL]
MASSGSQATPVAAFSGGALLGRLKSGAARRRLKEDGPLLGDVDSLTDAGTQGSNDRDGPMNDLQKPTCNETEGKEGDSKDIEMQDSPANSHAIQAVLPERQMKKISKLDDGADNFGSARHQAAVTELANGQILGLKGPSSPPQH